MVIAVNKTQISRQVSDLERRRQELKRCESSVSDIIRGFTIQGNARNGIIRKMKSIVSEINTEVSILSNMQKALSNGINLYEQNERKISYTKKKTTVNWNSAIPSLVGSAVITGKDVNLSLLNKEESENPFEVDWWDYVGEFGLIGKGISAVGQLVTKERNLKNNISSIKDFSGVIGGICSTVCKNRSDVTWKSLLGLDDFYDGMLNTNAYKTLSFGDKVRKLTEYGISDELDDLTGANASSWGDKLKVGTKWAGYALTLASNGVDNYKEMTEEGISAERAVGETIIETGVDIGVGIASSVAATVITGVAATAIGTVAPAIGAFVGSAGVVGAVGVGISWAANGFCKWATQKYGDKQKDLGELAADGFYYLKEKKDEFERSVGVKAGSTIKNVGKFVTKGLSTGWKSISSVFA